MNKRLDKLLIKINEEGFFTQRELANNTDFSLGYINKAIKELKANKLLDDNNTLTSQGKKKLEELKTKKAIILAAGYGMQTTPLNMNLPKAMIEIQGKRLIERVVEQLHQVGIKDIVVVVGFMKEKFEYLIDKYGLSLVVNNKYLETGSLFSLIKTIDNIDNAYIIPSDIWFRDNPFSEYETDSWYMIKKTEKNGSVGINKWGEISKKTKKLEYTSIGLSYIGREEKNIFSTLAKVENKKNTRAFWEDIVFNNSSLKLKSRIVEEDEAFEISTYEQLRNVDKNSDNLNVDAVSLIKKHFNIQLEDIKNISVLKKGMTNRSFTFEYKDEKYIMRIPGEGTDLLIDRKKEFQVYEAIKKYNISEDVLYMDSHNGYKISKFWKNSRNCQIDDERDLEKMIKALRDFHSLEIKVEHSFDEFEMIEFYQSLWNGKISLYEDYEITKKNVFKLKKYIKKERKTLCHIDSVVDNFLILQDEEGRQEVKLIDWEYSAMNDPHIDIAMFCIYSLCSKNQIDKIIDIYFDGKCDFKTRLKIYSYIAVCGLLWSNWCEYKYHQGVEFGQYSIEQYRYAKDYYKLVKDMIRESGENFE